MTIQDDPARRPAIDIRACRDTDESDILRVINAAAVAYRGVIPADRWHEPYMSPDEFRAEVVAGVRFTGYAVDGELIGVMGMQEVRNVRLIRHAYVLPGSQGRGIGSRLLEHLRRIDDRVVLIGTWRSASWAIGFYERHGFVQVPAVAIAPLLRTYWDIPARQVETSVVLASPALSASGAGKLIEGAEAS